MKLIKWNADTQNFHGHGERFVLANQQLFSEKFIITAENLFFTFDFRVACHKDVKAFMYQINFNLDGNSYYQLEKRLNPAEMDASVTEAFLHRHAEVIPIHVGPDAMGNEVTLTPVMTFGGISDERDAQYFFDYIQCHIFSAPY